MKRAGVEALYSAWTDNKVYRTPEGVVEAVYIAMREEECRSALKRYWDCYPDETPPEHLIKRWATEKEGEST